MRRMVLNLRVLGGLYAPHCTLLITVRVLRGSLRAEVSLLLLGSREALFAQRLLFLSLGPERPSLRRGFS